MSSFSVKFSPWGQQQIALSAVVQCAVLVSHLANDKQAADDNLITCINPLLTLNLKSID